MRKKLIFLAIMMLTTIFLFGCTKVKAVEISEDYLTCGTNIVMTTTNSIISTVTTNNTISTTNKTTSITTTTITTTATAAAVIETQKNIKKENNSIVYKPSTHYVHISSCHWVNSECYEITNTYGIEARLCTECKPQIEIQSPYIEPTPVVAGISDYEIQLLRKIVSSEYGSDWVSVSEKAKIVAGVINRVNDSRFPNTIYGVLTQYGQFPGFNPDGNYYISDSIIQAVDYYFAHPEEFGSYNSWSGDGTTNFFYYQ